MQSTNRPVFPKNARRLGPYTPADEARARRKLKRLKQTGFAGAKTMYAGRK